jgi:Rps23 Pro-64 3,4-dihydroxylase Tpa1-like proline 4-hydroxylase
MIDLARLDLPSLASAWRAARPFPHVVIDDLVSGETLAALRLGVSREPHWPERGEIVEVMASAQELRGDSLRAFAGFLGGAAALEAVRAITGAPVERVEVRSYVYLAGSYLLPHTDHRPGVDRRVAFAFYLSPPGDLLGGELDLYACTVDEGEIAATAVERTVEPRENRLALFDVSPVSLHRVREVTRGARVSLAGWFL